jgi:RNA polymerase sigma-70 factor (ECF subfamily)
MDDEFLEKINQNLGIAHKVCRIYFNSTADFDDALQEMMYQLWRSYNSFDGRSKFSTWMYRVCLNTALTYQRKYQRDKTEPLDVKHQQIQAEPTHDDNDAMALLNAAIKKLSPLNRAIILLYLEDLSYDEISNIIGLTKSNVSVKLVRIKKQLESELRNPIKTIEDVNHGRF